MPGMIRNDNIGNIALELLKDCGRNCTGCAVDTAGVGTPPEEDLLAIEEIVNEVRDREWEMSWMEIAPTDILSASNRQEVLENPILRRMVRGGFESIVFNCSFLSPYPEDYVKLAEELEAFMPGLNAEFLVPFEFKHYRNVGYFEKIRNRIHWLEENLKTVRIGTVTAIVNLIEPMIDSGLVNQDSLHETRHIKLFERSDTTTFVFHYGRTDLDVPENREEFLRTILKQNDLFAKQVDDGYPFKIDDLGPTVGTDYHLSYRKGQLYMAPFINSPIALFDDQFSFEKPWKLDDIIASDVGTYFKSIEKGMFSPDCKGCDFLSNCSTRGVQRVQEVLRTNKCLSILGQLGYKADW